MKHSIPEVIHLELREDFSEGGGYFFKIDSVISFLIIFNVPNGRPMKVNIGEGVFYIAR